MGGGHTFSNSVIWDSEAENGQVRQGRKVSHRGSILFIKICWYFHYTLTGAFQIQTAFYRVVMKILSFKRRPEKYI